MLVSAPVWLVFMTLLCVSSCVFHSILFQSSTLWVFNMGVSKNRGTPKSSHFHKVFHYFHHPFWGVNTPIFGGPPILLRDLHFVDPWCHLSHPSQRAFFFDAKLANIWMVVPTGNENSHGNSLKSLWTSICYLLLTACVLGGTPHMLFVSSNCLGSMWCTVSGGITLWSSWSSWSSSMAQRPVVCCVSTTALCRHRWLQKHPRIGTGKRMWSSRSGSSCAWCRGN